MILSKVNTSTTARTCSLASRVPWQIVLASITDRKNYARVRDQLLEENLSTVEQFTHCLAVFGDTKILPALTLFCAGQEFPIDFSGGPSLTTIGQARHRFLWNPFHLRPSPNEGYHPWNGAPITDVQVAHLSFGCQAPQSPVSSPWPVLSIVGGGCST